jgi:hypothetical protein
MDSDIATPINVAHDGTNIVGIDLDVLSIGASTKREHGWMLKQQQMIAVTALQLLLQ